jgi:hypothetical protein
MITQQISRMDAGQIHLMVVEFPAGTPPFNVDMAAELMRLHDVGLIRVLDLLVVLKDDDGQARGCEATSVNGLDIRRLESHLPRVLAADDVRKLAEPLDPGTAAGVVVWGDTWVAPLVSAAGRTGDIASVARPGSESTSSWDADTGHGQARGTWDPLSPARSRPGILRGSVARTPGVPHRSTDVLGRVPATSSSETSDGVTGDRLP